MKKLLILSLAVLSGCAFFQSHPKVVEDLIEDETKTIEDVVSDLSK